LDGDDGREQFFVANANANVVFEFLEADTDEMHMRFYPIGALSPKQSK
jgi:hypothetical protein